MECFFVYGVLPRIPPSVLNGGSDSCIWVLGILCLHWDRFLDGALLTTHRPQRLPRPPAGATARPSAARPWPFWGSKKRGFRFGGGELERSGVVSSSWCLEWLLVRLHENSPL